MREYITIIIAHHEGKPPKTLKIRKSHLKAFVASAVSFCFLSLLSYATSWHLLSERQKLKAEAKKLFEEKKMVLTQKERLNQEREVMKEKLRAIETKMATVEEYLSKRGVIGKTLAVGGASYKDVSYRDVSYLEFLEDRADYLLSKVKATPLGYPIFGRITSHMGWRKNPFGRGYEFHSGIDIEAPIGSKVKATADGVVEFAGRYFDYGKAVIIRHPSGYITLYGHLSQIDVKEGQKVKAGDIVGRVGSTGRSTGPHLHYEVIKDNRPINPLDFIAWR
ncbi:M23 family metallopeptidase [Hydrogenobacter thermophilus]|uniref:M23 family metallopeptidase n=1 Tax=Hydrogenobacter thermophilus TaxID=940 RepID=UPI0030F54933